MRDTVTVKSGTRKEDAPFIAKIAAFWQESGIRYTIYIVLTQSPCTHVMIDIDCIRILALRYC